MSKTWKVVMLVAWVVMIVLVVWPSLIEQRAETQDSKVGEGFTVDVGNGERITPEREKMEREREVFLKERGNR